MTITGQFPPSEVSPGSSLPPSTDLPPKVKPVGLHSSFSGDDLVPENLQPDSVERVSVWDGVDLLRLSSRTRWVGLFRGRGAGVRRLACCSRTAALSGVLRCRSALRPHRSSCSPVRSVCCRMFRNSLKMLLTGGKANRKSRGSGESEQRRRPL